MRFDSNLATPGDLRRALSLSTPTRGVSKGFRSIGPCLRRGLVSGSPKFLAFTLEFLPAVVHNNGLLSQGDDMLEELKEEEIVKKVGGRFKLSTLIQKRMVALNRGSKPLVELQTKNPMEIVVQEILHDKIYLDMSGEVKERPEGEFRRDTGPTLDDL